MRSLARKRASRRSILVIFARLLPRSCKTSATRWSTALPVNTIPSTKKAHVFFWCPCTPFNKCLTCSCQLLHSTLELSIEIVLRAYSIFSACETISFSCLHLLLQFGGSFFLPPP